MTTPRVAVHPDAEALAAAVATALLERLSAVQATGRVPHVALTGGSIADAVHRQVALLAPASDVDWSRVEIWWGDERFVAADSEDRNVLQARAILLDALPLDPDRVHEMPAAGAVLDVAAGAEAYEQVLHTRGSEQFDVVMLGVGPDGHVASLFPGRPQLDVDDRSAVAVTGSPKPPPERITLTFAALNRARAVWFLVSGEQKAAAVASALGGAPVHDVPAAGVTGAEETIWFVDSPAASRLAAN